MRLLGAGTLALVEIIKKKKKTTFCGLSRDDGSKKSCDFCSRDWITKLLV